MIGKRKAVWVWIFVFFLAFGSVSCKKRGLKSKTSPSGVLAPGAKIRVGEVGSMTGTDASFGVSTHHGIELALSEINAAGGVQGHPLELLSLDDQGKPNEAVLAITQLITQKKVLAVLGEVASTRTIAMAAIAQQNHVPLISPSSINSKVTQQGDYIFRVCYNDIFQSKVMADFALNQLHAKKAALLLDVKSDYSRDSARLFSENFKKGGGEIVLEQSYTSGDMDFKSQLTAIRATHPDVILVPGYYTEIGLIARQQKELGIQAPLLGGDGWDSPKLKEIGGSALDGSYFVTHFSRDNPTPQIQKFIQSYTSRFGGVAPDGLAALAYDSAWFLADAMNRARSLSPSEIREALIHTHDFAGVTGKISIGPDRNAVKSAYVFMLTEGGNMKRVLP
jgi:branched-chain amino acid transport system substrate-binding protein